MQQVVFHDSGMTRNKIIIWKHLTVSKQVTIIR